MLPEDVLAKLEAMDDYDRMLAFDRIGKDHRMSAAEVEAQYNAWKRGEPMPSAGAPVPQQPPIQGGQSANYLSDASKYRPGYDPSQEGIARRAQIDQAVMCPDCGSALGIPATRPIKVTCPSCMSNFTFTS